MRRSTGFARCAARGVPRSRGRTRARREPAPAAAVGALTMDEAVRIALAAQPRGDRGAPRHRGGAARRRRGAHLPEPGRVVRARQPGAWQRQQPGRHGGAAVLQPAGADASASARSSTCGPSAARARAPPSAASSSSSFKSRTPCARSSTPCARRSPTSRASSTSGSWRARSPTATARPCACRAARFRAGDISEAELRRVELEGLRYTNAVIDARSRSSISRARSWRA